MIVSMSTTVVPQIAVTHLTISPEEYPNLVFEETLRLVNVEGEMMDEVTVAVEDSGGVFMVYQYGQNTERMLRIQSSVFNSLQTQSEMRRIRYPPDRATMTRITGGEAVYHVITQCQVCDDSWGEKADIETSPSNPVLLEGANVVLLRKLAICHLYGQFKARTITHDVELCECVYDIEPSDHGQVIVRRTLKGSRETEVMTTVLSPEGRILSHRWSGSEWYLKVHTVEAETVIQQEEQQDEVIAEEMLKADQSAYFQRKGEVSEKLRQYILDHTDIQDLIADFLKDVLLEQPEDVVEFADTFFSEYLGIRNSREDQRGPNDPE